MPAWQILGVAAYSTCILLFSLIVRLRRVNGNKTAKTTRVVQSTFGLGIELAARPVLRSESRTATRPQAKSGARFRVETADAHGDIRSIAVRGKNSSSSKSHASSEGQVHQAMLAPIGTPNEGQEESAAAPATGCNAASLGRNNFGLVPRQPVEEMASIAGYLAADSDPRPAQGGTADVTTACAPPAEDIAVKINAPGNQDTAHDAEIAPAPMSDDDRMGTEAFPIQQTVETVEIAAASVEPSTVDFSGSLVHRAAEDVEVAPVPDFADAALDGSAPAVRRAAYGVDITPTPVAGDTPEGVIPTQMQDTGDTKAPRTLPVSEVGKEPLPPTFSFLSFYGLSEQPFDVTPDPAYLYLSPVHREALISLSQGIQNLRGFMALVAEPGMGKTTLLNRLMEELRETTRTVFLFQTQCNPRELLRYLLSELGIESAAMDVVAMHNALNKILFEEMLNGRRFVLIVDEAQNLDPSTLETIRLLSDFETTHAKLIQIVLAGQPQLIETLLQPNLSQLRQRIAILTSLEPLCASETTQYVEHRLRSAGLRGGSIFTPDALALIAERSQGIPRNINNLCFNALQLGYSEGCDPIDADVVLTVAARLDLKALSGCHQQNTVSNQDAPAASLSPSSQLARILLDALAGEHQAAQRPLNGGHAKTTMALTGRLTEKLRSRSWGKECEFRIQVSLERQGSSDIPVADRYYCCSIYVSEEQAKYLQAGQPVRIRIEQD